MDRLEQEAQALNEQHAFARNCGHSKTEQHDDGSIECLDCGIFGKIKWPHLLAPDEEFVASRDTPMGLEIRRKPIVSLKEHGRSPHASGSE